MNIARYGLAFALGVLATLGGSWIGQAWREHERPVSAIDRVLHEDLGLDAGQEQRIAKLEADFAHRRAALEADLKAANADLAHALEREHEYGPAVAQAVDRSHRAMGALQKATLSHVFAMRSVLHADQLAGFDTAVNKALTQPSAE